MKKYLLVIPIVAGVVWVYAATSDNQVAKQDEERTVIAQATVQKTVEDFEVNEEQKRRDCVELTKKAIDFLMKNRTEVAFNNFVNSRDFTKGDVRIFVYDDKGTSYVGGPRDAASTWHNFHDYRNRHNIYPFRQAIELTNKGGGWLNYEWKNWMKSSYMEQVVKDGKKFIIGAGWYPISKKYRTLDIVKSAVAYFQNEGRVEAFKEFSSSFGDFIQGDLYIFVYDMSGHCVAHGDNPGLIGRNLIDFKDENGKFVVKKLLETAKDGGGWVEYRWKNAPKLSYAELVTDKSGDYVVGSGYYPESDRDEVVELVKKGVRYFKAWGRQKAAQEFSLVDGDFVFGDLFLYMYDDTGKCLGHGGDPELVGQNLIDFRSSDGKYIIKDMVELTKKKGGGWLDYRQRNGLVVTYNEGVKDRDGRYVIGAGFWPGTHREQIIGLVRLGAEFFRKRGKQAALEAFSDLNGGFIQGDRHLFVYTLQGDCLVSGDRFDMIWQNYRQFKDAAGRQVIPLLIQKAKKGGGFVEYQSRNTSKLAYVELLEHEGEQYIIGSAFYQ